MTTADEATSPGAALGKAIRRARRDAKLTLKDLGRRVELSHSYLSEVENGVSSLSINSLYLIAEALDTSPQELLAPGGGTAITVVRAGTGWRNEVEPPTRVLVSGPDREIEALEYTLEPGYDSGMFEHEGDELILVHEGSLEATVAEQPPVELGPGDSMAYPATVPHRWTAGTDGARVLIIMSHVRRPINPHR